MTRRQRDLHRLLQHVADRANAKILRVKCTGSGHQRATLVRSDGNIVHLIAASSPSDRRAGRTWSRSRGANFGHRRRAYSR